MFTNTSLLNMKTHAQCTCNLNMNSTLFSHMTLFVQNRNKYENTTNNYINHMNPSMPILGRIDPKIADLQAHNMGVGWREKINKKNK